MVQAGFSQSNNDVIQGESPFLERLAVKTAANCYPGRLVIRDTTDYQIQVCGAAGAPVGWIGYGETPAHSKPATRDTVHVAGDEVAVHSGGGFRVRASLANGQNVVKGAYLTVTAAGELIAAAAITIVASGAANITNGQGVTGTYGAAGPVVAIADESVDASGSALPIWVRSMI